MGYTMQIRGQHGPGEPQRSPGLCWVDLTVLYPSGQATKTNVTGLDVSGRVPGLISSYRTLNGTDMAIVTFNIPYADRCRIQECNDQLVPLKVLSDRHDNRPLLRPWR